MTRGVDYAEYYEMKKRMDEWGTDLRPRITNNQAGNDKSDVLATYTVQ